MNKRQYDIWLYSDVCWRNMLTHHFCGLHVPLYITLESRHTINSIVHWVCWLSLNLKIFWNETFNCFNHNLSVLMQLGPWVHERRAEALTRRGRGANFAAPPVFITTLYTISCNWYTEYCIFIASKKLRVSYYIRYGHRLSSSNVYGWRNSPWQSPPGFHRKQFAHYMQAFVKSYAAILLL